MTTKSDDVILLVVQTTLENGVACIPTGVRH